MTFRVCSECGGVPQMVELGEGHWRKECAACGSTGPFAPVCGFCKNGPVGNAATWLDGKPRPPAPCPRCGKTYPRASRCSLPGAQTDDLVSALGQTPSEVRADADKEA